MENLPTKQNMREPTNAICPLKRDKNVFIEDNIPLKLYRCVYVYIYVVSSNQKALICQM